MRHHTNELNGLLRKAVWFGFWLGFHRLRFFVVLVVWVF